MRHAAEVVRWAGMVVSGNARVMRSFARPCKIQRSRHIAVMMKGPESEGGS